LIFKKSKQMKNYLKIWSLAGVVGTLSLVAQAHGQTVAWGGSVSESTLSFDSKGNADTGSMIWQLGYFATGYTPTATNYSTWAANWNSVDVGSHRRYDDPDPLSEFPVLYAANEIVDDPGPSAVGKIMYTFVHNGGSADPAVWGPLMGTADGEALLYTSGLTFQPVPAPTVSFNIANNPLDASDDNTFQVIWGRVDRNMYLDSLWGGTNTPASPAPANGGVITGGGLITSPVPDSQTPAPYDFLNGTFENQTATWQIPEPSAAFLGAISALLLLRRRR
jgi:hypothetical protein